MMWWRIEAPHMCAGFRVSSGIVVEVAPIIHWMLGKSFSYIQSWAHRKGYTLQSLNVSSEK